MLVIIYFIVLVLSWGASAQLQSNLHQYIRGTQAPQTLGGENTRGCTHTTQMPFYNL